MGDTPQLYQEGKFFSHLGGTAPMAEVKLLSKASPEAGLCSPCGHSWSFPDCPLPST